MTAQLGQDGRDVLRRPVVTGFALFAEVLGTGAVVTLLCLPIVTAPAALWAGAQCLTRSMRGQEGGLRLLLRLWVVGLRGLLGLGFATFALGLLLALDVMVVAAGGLPGAAIIGWITGALALVGVCVLLLVATTWSTGESVVAHVLRALRDLTRSIRATALLASSVGLTIILTWQLPPLVLPAVGCALLAVVAIRHRYLDGVPRLQQS